MSAWVAKGLETGIQSSRYPDTPEVALGVSPGLPVAASYSEDEARALAERCPSGALEANGGRVTVDYRRCIHAFRCVRETPTPLDWNATYEWAGLREANADRHEALPASFARSVHVLVVDAGDCGACLNEVKQLDNPYYNMHRLGFFITPTPRQADVMLVVGPGTVPMQTALEKAYDAMPTPKRVIAVGACALSGGVFGPSFVCGAGVHEFLPVDVEVPGNPPPPLAILHALLVATGRKAPASLASPPHG